MSYNQPVDSFGEKQLKYVDEKYVVVRKIDKVVVVSGSRGPQKTELQDLQLGVVM